MTERTEKTLQGLRRIHVGILAILFAVLALRLASNESEVSRARSQLDGIDHLVANWRVDWLQVYARDYNARRPIVSPPRQWHLRLDEQIRNLKARERTETSLLQDDTSQISLFPVQEKIPGVTTPDNDKKIGADAIGLPNELRLKKPESLREFKTLWNELAEPIQYHLNFQPSEKGKYFALTGFAGIMGSVTLSPSEDSQDRVYPVAVRWHKTKHLMLWDVEGLNAVFEAKPSSTRAFHGQQAIIHSYSNDTSGRTDEWALGTFDETFPDLARITAYYMDVSIGDISQILDSELERMPSAVTFFGVQVPSESVPLWSLIIISLGQFYFLLQITHVTSMEMEGMTEMAYTWIGAHPNRVSRAFTICTIVIGPAILAGYEAMQLDVVGLQRVIVVSLVWASILATNVLLVRKLVKMWLSSSG